MSSLSISTSIIINDSILPPNHVRWYRSRVEPTGAPINPCKETSELLWNESGSRKYISLGTQSPLASLHDLKYNPIYGCFLSLLFFPFLCSPSFVSASLSLFSTFSPVSPLLQFLVLTPSPLPLYSCSHSFLSCIHVSYQSI